MKTSPVQSAATTTTSLLARRFAAMAVDLVVLGLPYLVVRRVSSGAMAAGVVAILAVAVFGIVQGETGTTVGKSLLGLHLVNEYGRPPGTAMALLRLAAWVIDALPCVGLIGVLLIWFSPSHQRVGDTITRSFVLGLVRDGEAAADEVEHGPAPDPYHATDEERQDFKPLWDGKVNAYVQWDPAMKRWMKYDELTEVWTTVEDH